MSKQSTSKIPCDDTLKESMTLQDKWKEKSFQTKLLNKQMNKTRKGMYDLQTNSLNFEIYIVLEYNDK